MPITIKAEDGSRHLQTLPNIDINIKCGNSLASVHSVCLGKKITEVYHMQNLARDYKRNVHEYKNCSSKAVKNKLNQQILAIKAQLLPGVQVDMFDFDTTQAGNRPSVMKNALEWMIEFPEVLNEDGTFKGFDVVIGNPPYISLEKLRREAEVYRKMNRLDENNAHTVNYSTLESRGDIYTLFVERGLQLLREGGLLSYIMPNKWEKVMYGRPLRKLFLDKNLSHLVDFGDNQLFEDATTYTCIIRMSNEPSKGELAVSTIEEVDPETLLEDVEEQRELFDKNEMDDDIWVVSSLNNFYQIDRLKREMTTLGEYIGGEAYRGILSGLSDAFNISIERAETLVKQDESSKKLLRPFLQGRGMVAYGEAQAGSYLIFIPKGFTANIMGIDRSCQRLPSEEEAWKCFKERYPAIASWLAPFADRARRRSDKGDYWWELRACAYYDKFEEPKICYQRIQVRPCFTFVESNAFCKDTIWFMSVKEKVLLPLLCSNVGWWLISEYCPPVRGGYLLIWENFSRIPIPRELPAELNDYADRLMAARENETEFAQLSTEVDNIIRNCYKLS